MQRRCIKVELLRREQCKHRSTEHKPHLSFFWLFTFLRRAHISDSRALLTFSGANVQRCSVQFLKSATSKNVKLPFSHICCLLSATKLQSFCHYFPFPPPLFLLFGCQRFLRLERFIRANRVAVTAVGVLVFLLVGHVFAFMSGQAPHQHGDDADH